MADWRTEQDDPDAEDRAEDTWINENEKLFLLEGIRDYDFRADGRGPLDYRSLQIKTGEVNSASGSARVRVGNSSVLAALKLSIAEPERSAPDEGYLEISVESSLPLAYHGDEDEDEDALTTQEIEQILACIYQESGGIDRKKLCIVPGAKCWSLFFDIVVFEQGASILDAATIAIKAALSDAKFPTVQVVESELDQSEIEYSDNPYDFWKVDVSAVPTVVSLFKIGPVFVVDVSKEEQVTADASVIVAGNVDRRLFYHSTDCCGTEFGFHIGGLEEAMNMAVQMCVRMNQDLNKALAEK